MKNTFKNKIQFTACFYSFQNGILILKQFIYPFVKNRFKKINMFDSISDCALVYVT